MSLPRKVLEKYINPSGVFVETGSRWGLTLVRAIECGAIGAYGCEREILYAGIANAILSDVSPDNTNVENCDSSTFLSCSFSACAVFLDAHTETESPVLEELDLIAKWPNKPDAILIDDLRCMKGWGVLVDRLQGKLLDMGYRVGYEDGVEPRDIMVGVMP